MGNLTVIGEHWKSMEKHDVLYVWLEHLQRMRMGCRVRRPETLEWSLQGRRRKSENPSATMSGNDVRNSGRSARPRPPPTPLSWQRAIPKKKDKQNLLVQSARPDLQACYMKLFFDRPRKHFAVPIPNNPPPISFSVAAFNFSSSRVTLF